MKLAVGIGIGVLAVLIALPLAVKAFNDTPPPGTVTITIEGLDGIQGAAEGKQRAEAIAAAARALETIATRSRLNAQPSQTGHLGLSNYDRVSNGLSSGQVRDVLGFPGLPVDCGGILPEGTEAFQWFDSSGGNAIVLFDNGKVAAKAEAGLK